jgi:hypothetical protein
MSVTDSRPCGCGGGGTPSGFDPAGQPWIDVNAFGVRPMGDDAENCEPYHGAFPGTSVFLVGHGTEHERVFIREQRNEAWTYATENELTFQHINATELCHDRIVALFGA